jgi:hypothetical protein
MIAGITEHPMLNTSTEISLARSDSRAAVCALKWLSSVFGAARNIEEPEVYLSHQPRLGDRTE